MEKEGEQEFFEQASIEPFFKLSRILILVIVAVVIICILVFSIFLRESNREWVNKLSSQDAETSLEERCKIFINNPERYEGISAFDDLREKCSDYNISKSFGLCNEADNINLKSSCSKILKK